MARKAGDLEETQEDFEKQRRSFVITNGESVIASYGPADPYWNGKSLSLKSVIEEWTKPMPNHDSLVLTADSAVWHQDKLVAIVREVAPNKYEVLVLDYMLLN